jgi:hypothetical protein
MPFSPEISSQTTLGGEDQSLVTFKILLGSNDIAPLLGVIGITIQRAVNKVICRSKKCPLVILIGL